MARPRKGYAAAANPWPTSSDEENVARSHPNSLRHRPQEQSECEEHDRTVADNQARPWIQTPPTTGSSARAAAAVNGHEAGARLKNRSTFVVKMFAFSASVQAEFFTAAMLSRIEDRPPVASNGASVPNSRWSAPRKSRATFTAPGENAPMSP